MVLSELISHAGHDLTYGPNGSIVPVMSASDIANLTAEAKRQESMSNYATADRLWKKIDNAKNGN